jgi:hypothetical protein
MYCGRKKGEREFVCIIIIIIIRKQKANNHKEDIKQIGRYRYAVVDGVRKKSFFGEKQTGVLSHTQKGCQQIEKRYF